MPEIEAASVARRDPRTSALYLAIGAGAVARIQAAFLHSPSDILLTDMKRHWDHGVFPLLDQPLAAIDPPGYQLWLAAVRAVTHDDRFQLSVYAALLSVLTIWLWYRFAREALSSKCAALLFAALLTWSPSWIAIFGYIMPETLFLPVLGASLWSTWRTLRKPSALSSALCCALWLLSMSTRILAMPVALICLGAVLYVRSSRWKVAVIYAALTLAILMPFALRAHRVLGVWAPLGHPAMNRIYARSTAKEVLVVLRRPSQGQEFQYHFLSPSMSHQPFEPLSDWHSNRSGLLTINVNLDAGSRDWDRALASAPPVWARLPDVWKENAIFLLFDASWPDNQQERFWDRRQIEQRWILLPLLLVVMLGNAHYFWQHRSLHLLIVMNIALWALILLAPAAVPEARYRKPLEGLTLLNLVWLAEKRKLDRQR
ncbi:MAG: glycosyltransferase family 39 protein [Acidobacteriales bacterium]|nr:glycosyltransferase family 39 protein [Terriglobales bacterium]